jgi:hypothetical protein
MSATMISNNHQTKPFSNLRRKFIASAAYACALPWPKAARAAITLEGVALQETMTAYGQKLVLNGAGVRKRGYFKADVTALYLPEKRTTADAIYKLDGIRRIQLNMLRSFTASTISRIFLSDFKQAATEEEARKIVYAISQIGAAYADVKGVFKGDVINLDWVPGQGWLSSINGKLLSNSDGTPFVIQEALAYQIYLRMYIGASAPEDLRNSLLGLVRLDQGAS